MKEGGGSIAEEIGRGDENGHDIMTIVFVPIREVVL